MKTAGLTSLLLLSLLLARTGSVPPTTTGSSSTTGSPTDSQSPGPGPQPTQPVKQTDPVTSDGKSTSEKPVTKADSAETKSVTTTSSMAPNLSSESKPTEAAPSVKSTERSLPKTESPPSTKSTGETPGSNVTVVPVVSVTDSAESLINGTGKSQSQETDPTKEAPASAKAPGTMVPSNATEDKPGGPAVPPGGNEPQGNKGSEKQQGETNETPDPAKSSADKKMLWILLPVLMVLVAGVIFVLKKYTKGHAHTDTTENGMENASFQSRSDSNKDGVMLLGVKTSAGEENAAAR